MRVDQYRPGFTVIRGVIGWLCVLAFSVSACSSSGGAQPEAVGRCYLMPGLGWTAPEGPIQKIVKDPRHGRDVYYVKRSDGAELFLQPEGGQVVDCSTPQ